MIRTLPSAIALLTVVALRTLPAHDPSSPSPDDVLETAITLLKERQSTRESEKWDRIRQEFRAHRAAVSRAYEAAARLRQDFEIIDPDPESVDVVVQLDTRGRAPSDEAATRTRQKNDVADPNPKGAPDRALPKYDPILIEYLRRKDAYLQAKEHLEVVERSLQRGCGPFFDPVANRAKEKALAFEIITDLLQTGKVTDPNPEDPKSRLVFAPEDQAAADFYVEQKAYYLAAKERSLRACIKNAPNILMAVREEASQAYHAAAFIRRDHKIVDLDPENAGAIVSPKDHPNVVEYLRFKNSYLQINAELAWADALLPISVFETAASTTEAEANEAFARVDELLQSGKIADPDPNNPDSAVSLAASDKKTAAAYIERKVNYLVLKNRSQMAAKALATAKARKMPATGITK